MKQYKWLRQILLLTIFAIGGGYAAAGLSSVFSQEKPKDIAVKPATVDVPFTASDAVEINKLRVIREDADRKIGEILTSYGGEGEVLLDKHGNYVGIRRTEKKP